MVGKKKPSVRQAVRQVPKRFLFRCLSRYRDWVWAGLRAVVGSFVQDGRSLVQKPFGANGLGPPWRHYRHRMEVPFASLAANSMDRVPVTRFDVCEGFRSLAVVSAALTVMLFGLLVIDPRMLGAEPIWLKPFKFSLFFAVLFATLAVFARLLSDTHRFGLLAVGAVAASGAVFLFELSYIMGQAARVEPSHCNESTPFREMMYGLMGTGAAMLMGSIFAVGALVLVDRAGKVGPSLRL